MSNAKSDAKRNEKSDDAMHSRAIYRALADSAPTDRPTGEPTTTTTTTAISILFPDNIFHTFHFCSHNKATKKILDHFAWEGKMKTEDPRQSSQLP